jgi:hypothetical protein
LLELYLSLNLFFLCFEGVRDYPRQFLFQTVPCLLDVREPGDPLISNLHGHIGEAYLFQGDNSAAVTHYREALKLSGSLDGNIEHINDVNVAFMHDALARGIKNVKNNSNEELRHSLIALKIKQKLMPPMASKYRRFPWAFSFFLCR